MRNLEAVVKILFQYVSVDDILQGKIYYNDFPKSTFMRIALAEMNHLTETEIEEMYRYIHEMQGEGKMGLHTFKFLKYISLEKLYIRDNMPICRYEELLQWRKIVQCIGEDLPICAFLASRTERSGYKWNDFEWNAVIDNDNMQLKRILQKGVSDNHFHLFGSAPSFSLAWINLMNNIEDDRFAIELRKLDCDRKMKKITVKETSLEAMHYQAAIIRSVLFYYIQLVMCKNEDRQNKLIGKKDEILWTLNNTSSAFFSRGDVQIFINSLRANVVDSVTKECLDYATWGYGRRSINHDFEGERAFLYQMLLGAVNSEQVPEFLLNLFYAYLVIKIRLYGEMVQVNDNIGFANFSQYNKRSRPFLPGQNNRKRMVQHAVGGSFRSGCLKSLEIRISPELSVADNRKSIKKLDEYIKECNLDENVPLNSKGIYYVLHFPKQPDRELASERGFIEQYRHFDFRLKLEAQAKILIEFREKSPQEASRVLGIDACSMEIGCRPEVMAPAFRLLTNHVVSAPNIYNVKQWKITFHVGEDWLDMIDGLRAMDEAMLFLNMKNGDRMGHGTVLGIDAKRWYEYKKKSICISKQDYLDNIVWMYHKLIEYNIPDCETLKGFLLKEYEVYFYQLYRQYIEENDIRAIIQLRNGQMRKVHQHNSMSENISFLHFDIGAYYDAWKLRGDDPALYKNGYYWNPLHMLQEDKANYELKKGNEIRHRIESSIIYFYYHYSADVRYNGRKTMYFDASDIYIEGVYKIQKAMQQQIADKGICIETNPSSNYLISAMQRYEDHPIRNLYNMGLTMNGKEVMNCSQLNVSINTDDKGVFYTSIENEYALMGCAMEQVCDEKGNRKYHRQMIHQWLDNIREQGNQQSFLERM